MGTFYLIGWYALSLFLAYMHLQRVILGINKCERIFVIIGYDV